MDREIQLRKRIMRRVMTIYFARTLTSPLARVAVFIAALSAVVSTVSVKDILANAASAAHTPHSLALYMLNAFTSTEFFVQLFVVVSIALGVVLVRDLCMVCLSGQAFAFLRRVV